MTLPPAPATFSAAKGDVGQANFDASFVRALALAANTNRIDWPCTKDDIAGAPVTARPAALARDWDKLGKAGTRSFLPPNEPIIGVVLMEELAASVSVEGCNQP